MPKSNWFSPDSHVNRKDSLHDKQVRLRQLQVEQLELKKNADAQRMRRQQQLAAQNKTFAEMEAELASNRMHQQEMADLARQLAQQERESLASHQAQLNQINASLERAIRKSNLDDQALAQIVKFVETNQVPIGANKDNKTINPLFASLLEQCRAALPQDDINNVSVLDTSQPDTTNHSNTDYHSVRAGIESTWSAHYRTFFQQNLHRKPHYSRELESILYECLNDSKKLILDHTDLTDNRLHKNIEKAMRGIDSELCAILDAIDIVVADSDNIDAKVNINFPLIKIPTKSSAYLLTNDADRTYTNNRQEIQVNILLSLISSEKYRKDYSRLPFQRRISLDEFQQTANYSAKALLEHSQETDPGQLSVEQLIKTQRYALKVISICLNKDLSETQKTKQLRKLSDSIKVPLTKQERIAKAKYYTKATGSIFLVACLIAGIGAMISAPVSPLVIGLAAAALFTGKVTSGSVALGMVLGFNAVFSYKSAKMFSPEFSGSKLNEVCKSLLNASV